MTFFGTNILITGSTRGIGKEIAERFLKLGADTFINSRNEEEVTNVVDIFCKQGLRAHSAPGDITSEKDVRYIFHTIKARGGVDVLVNNAAYRPPDTQFINMSLVQWNQAMSTNVTGNFLTCKAALEHMLEKERGVIINISSTVATEPLSYYRGVDYVASKTALLGMTKGLMVEYAGSPVRIHAIVCGPIQKGNIPPKMVEQTKKDLGRDALADSKDVAQEVLRLAHDETIQSGTVVTIGGMISEKERLL